VERLKVLLSTSKCAAADVNYDALAPHLGLYRLKNHLGENNFQCDVFDVELDSEKNCIENVERGLFAIIGVSVTHWNMASDLDFLWKLKGAAIKSGQKCLFIAGGQSATQNYKQWLECGFDLIVLGYGEDTLLNICERYSKNREAPIWELFHDLRGVAFLGQNGNEFFNPSVPLTKAEFERLSFTQVMELDLPYHRYWDHLREKASYLIVNNRSYVIENARLYTSNRCLATCGFCGCVTFLQDAQGAKVPFSMLSASQILQLIIYHVERYGAKSFSFNDEDFLLGNRIGIERGLKLCELISESKKRGEIPEDTKFSCQTRPRNFFIWDKNRNGSLNHKLLEEMRKARFHNISLGVETFSERLLRCPSINKDDFTTDNIHTVLKGIMDYGLYPSMNLIVGIPESTKDDLREMIQTTLDYLKRPCQVCLSNEMRAFPGAPNWHSKDFPTTYKTWTNPITGQNSKIIFYYIPKDEKVAVVIGQLEKTTNEMLDEVRVSNNWDNLQLMPRTVVALSKFKAIAKIMDEGELLQRADNMMVKMLSQG
jgi:radical SAM superfamily enzyme YgiQ (UPF0313 family)|tara:strand:- start:966 stop:2588 length:1623 start_codon:yes stop_codon:yes gene_type:complete